MANSKVPSSQPFATQIPADVDPAAKVYSQEVVFQRATTRQRPQIIGVSALASTGTVQGDAAALSINSPFTNVSGGDGVKGVILPVAQTGTVIHIYNAGTGALKIYPATGGAINGGTANASINLAAKGVARAVNLDGLNWAI
jgi:hypothetical protein